MPRFLLLLAGALACALTVAVGASSRTVDATVPQLLAPANGAVHTAGTPMVFTVQTHPADMLWMHVSRSPNPIEVCGKIANDIGTYSATPTVTDASVYDVRPPNYTYSGYWLATPGTYYWQIYRIDYTDANGCVPSEVRSLVVQAAPKPKPTTTTTTPKPTPAPTPAPKPKPKPAVKPKPRPLALGKARLQGTFNVHYRLTSVHSFDEKVGSTGDFTWGLRARCKSGACSTRLTMQSSGSFVLARSGAVYHGTGNTQLTSCLMSAVWGPTDVRIAVKKAAWIGDRWLATRWGGTLSHSWTSHGLCTGGSFTAMIVGTIELG
jgi:hypothetical protein